VREPGIIRWPGKIRPGGVSDEPVATLDFFPTALALAAEPAQSSKPQLPIDGKNILPFLLGQNEKGPEALYLFFDGPYLQTARAGRWKIHVARWNIPRYTAASAQQKNVRLVTPELYDMNMDVAESYDVAAQHTQLVSELKARIVAALHTFPEEIRQANADLLDSK